MADNAEKLDIKIATQYDGAGAQAARTDVEATGTVVEKQASVFERLAKERAENDARMNAATTEETAAQAKLTIEQEKQLIVATRRAMIEAAIAGDQTELSKLRSELAVRQLTIQTLQTEQMAQEQINALLVEQDALIKEAAASVAAKAAAEEAEAAAAAEQTTVYGPRNRNLRLLKNFGVDGNTIASMSIVVLLATELYRIGEGVYKAEEKRREELEKETNEFQEQTHHLEDQIGASRTLDEMTKARGDAEANVTALLKKRGDASTEEKALIDQQLASLNSQIVATFKLTDSARQRVTAEEAVKRALDAQDQSLKQQLATLQEQRRLNNEQLDFENRLSKAKLDAALEDVRIAEDRKKIDHEEAAKERAVLKANNDQERFDRTQVAYDKDMENAKAQIAVINAADKQRMENLSALQKQRQEAIDKEKAGHEAIQAQEEAGRLSGLLSASQQRDFRDRFSGPSLETRNLRRSLEDAIATQRAMSDGLPRRKDGMIDIEALHKSVVDSGAQVGDVQKDEDKQSSTATTERERLQRAYDEAKRKKDENDAIYAVEAPSQAQGAGFAIQKGSEADQAEKERKAEEARKAAEKAKKEREAQAKKDQPFVDESNTIQSRAGIDITAGLQGSANARAKQILDHLSKSPLDMSAMKELSGVLSQIIGVLAGKDAAAKNDMQKIKADIETLRSQYAEDRHTGDHSY